MSEALSRDDHREKSTRASPVMHLEAQQKNKGKLAALFDQTDFRYIIWSSINEL